MTGRRRSGKTTLLTAFMNRHPNSLYFLAREESSQRNLMYFRRAAGEFLGSPDAVPRDADWNRTFREVARRSGGQKVVIIMDEFQRIGLRDPSFPSLVRYIWDTTLRGSHVMLVLCGSSLRAMSAQVTGYGAPLRGAVTAQVDVRPLPFSDSWEFHDTRDPAELLSFYAVTGGVPRYMEDLARYSDVLDAVRSEVLDPSSYLYGEVMAGLREEVRDAGAYCSVLASIASGRRKLQDIADDLGVRQTGLTNYLKVLMSAGLVEREVPVTEDDPSRSKRGLYRITDRLTDFWFRFVYPDLDLLERGDADRVAEHIREGFPGYLASVYADVCLQRVAEMSAEGAWGFPVTRAGRYWGRDAPYTGVVGIDAAGRNLLLGDCSPSDGPKGTDALDSLRARSRAMEYLTGTVRTSYAVFSRTGFTEGLRAAAERGEVRLVEDL